MAGATGVAAWLLAAAMLLALAPAGAQAQGTPWWAAFREPALDPLLQGTRGAPPPAQVALVQGWLVLRTDHSRLAMASRLLDATKAEQALLMNAEPGGERDRALADVARRLEAFEAAATGLQGERDRVLHELSQRSGLAPAELLRWADGAGARAVPAVDSVPPNGEDLAPEARQVAEQAVLAERLQWLLQARQFELQAAQARERAGAGDELQTLQALQRLMIDSDRLATARGRLALAWASWLPAATGGR